MNAFLVGLLATGLVGAVQVQVDATADRHPISQDIYGINGAHDDQVARMGAPVRRWGGGNPSTRYNWKTGIANRAQDWYFESIAGSEGDPDAFASTTLSAGARPIIPVTTIGWITKSNGSDRFCGFSLSKYPDQASCPAPDDSDCGQGVVTTCWDFSTPANIVTFTTDPHDTSFDAGAEWSQEWVGHLSSEGVHLIQLDNEPGIWNSTHRDVHPQRTTYAEMQAALFNHGAAIRAADPEAEILGPVSWGWTEYFYLTYVAGNNPDHDSNGDFTPWYLDQAAAFEQDAGVRILDYLDVHDYPQESGVYSNDVSAPTVALRLQSTRSFWDPTYVDPTWIGEAMQMVPRMRAWVSGHYPGTKTAITEYSWGAIDAWSGAIAQADILGIFGREQLDLATLFGAPCESGDDGCPVDAGDTSIGEDAFRLFRNYDNAGAQFGTTSVQATTSAVDTVTAYAGQTNGGALTIVLINKDSATQAVNVSIAGVDAGAMRAFAFGQSSDGGLLRLGPTASPSTGVGGWLVSMAPYTAELIEVSDGVIVAVPDAGSGSDAGLTSDAGQSRDAGIAGSGSVTGQSGCGCRSSTGLVWLGLVAMLTILRRRQWA